MRRILAAALSVAAAFASVVLLASPAQAAIPQCNHDYAYQTQFWNPNLGTWRYEDIPVYGSTDSHNCELKQGDDSSAVKALQTSLVICFSQNIAEDGDFGPATKAALKHAQTAVGVTSDGIFGPNTRAAFEWPAVPVLPGESGPSACLPI